MVRRISYYSSTVLIFFGFLATAWWWHQLFWIMTIEGAFILAMFRIFSRRSWRAQGWLWFTYALLPIFAYPQFLQLADAESSIAAWLYAVMICCVWAWLLFTVAQHYESNKVFEAHQYIEANQFIYLISFWQIANLFYFSLVNLNFPFWLAVSILLISSLIMTWQLIVTHGHKKGSLWLLLTAVPLTTAEIAVASNLLPISYYMQAAFVALWFYFVTRITILGQDISSRRKLFWRSLIFIVAAAMVLILTRLL